MSSQNFFQVDQNTVLAVAAKYGRTEKSLQDDVDTIRTWMGTQKHLPELLDDKYLVNFLFLNKCSIEKTKQRIDMYYTLRTVMPDMFENINPKCEIMQLASQIMCWVPLPKLNDQMHRIWIFKVLDKDLIDKLCPRQVMALLMNIQEIRFREDVMYGDVGVCDWEGINFDYMRKLTPSMVAKMFGIYEKMYSIPMKGFYFVNAPPFASIIMNIVKKLLKPKLYNRFSVHEDASVVSTLLPKEYIPKDYGGDAKSVKDLFEDLKKKFDQYEDRYEKLEKLRVDESLRQEVLQNDDVLGFHGNFKKLDID